MSFCSCNEVQALMARTAFTSFLRKGIAHSFSVSAPEHGLSAGLSSLACTSFWGGASTQGSEKRVLRAQCRRNGSENEAFDRGRSGKSMQKDYGKFIARLFVSRPQYWNGLRGVSTITNTGVPKPRPEVEESMSTIHGGHITKSINFSSSALQIRDILRKHEHSLSLLHVTLAARKLERLHLEGKISPSNLEVQLLARTIQDFATGRTVWLSAWSASNIVRSLTALGYKMQPQALMLLGAVLTAEDCRRLRMEMSFEWRDVAVSFARQGFRNDAFWSKYCKALQPLIGSWWPNVLLPIVEHVCLMHQPEHSFLAAAGHAIKGKVPRMTGLETMDALEIWLQIKAALEQPASHASTKTGGSSTSKPLPSPESLMIANISRAPQCKAPSRPEGESVATIASSAPTPVDLDLGELLATLKAGSLAHALTFDAANLSRLASLLRRVGLGDKEVPETIGHAAMELLGANSAPSELHHVLSACLLAGVGDPTYYSRIVEKARGNIRDADPSLQARFLKALRAAPIKHLGIVEEIEEELLSGGQVLQVTHATSA